MNLLKSETRLLFYNMNEQFTNITNNQLLREVKRRRLDPVHLTDEEGYLQLLRNIMTLGIDKDDRTGVGTRSLFAGHLRFNLNDQFPLLTTKRMWLKGIFYELMWILSGSTDNADLQKNNVHIWDGNSSREFLDSRSLQHYQEGDIGPTYGFAVRSYGYPNYHGCQENYIGKTGGFDQLKYVINLLKNNPSSRRILINLWDPTVINQVALTPCMMTYNFYVDTQNKRLNLQMYIRSSDAFLGLPWNIGYGAMLVYLLCHVKGINLIPGELTIATSDSHIYQNHFDVVKKNLDRNPYPFPQLKIKQKKENILDFQWSDIELNNYICHKSIKAPMAV